MKTVNLLIQQWKQKQSELELAGLDKKEAIAITTEKKKNRDLAKLKSMGGPFVSSEEVDSFMDNKGHTRSGQRGQIVHRGQILQRYQFNPAKGFRPVRLKTQIQKPSHHHICFQPESLFK